MMIREQILQQLKTVFTSPDDIIELTDDNGVEGHFHCALSITSRMFDGKSRVEQSQMVYAALDSLLKSGAIHALQLKLSIPPH